MDLSNLNAFFAKITGQNTLSGIKAAVAILACLLLYYESQALAKSIAPRTKQIVGGVLAVAAITCYFLFFHLSYKGYYHRWEFFHYYMGSKYAKELSYEKIYVCSAIADSETGNEKAVKRRKMRDLRVNSLVPSTDALANPGACKDAFTPEKWQTFKSDLIWFRQASGTNYWNDMQKDHGYNPPPVWTVAGYYISWLAPAGDAFFKLLAGIDVAFSAGMFILIAWAFGWRAMVVSAIFWGTQEPAPFYWTGGAFLRQDWMFLAVLSASLVRKRYYFWAGFALAYSAMLRVFPVLLWAGPLVMIASDVIRNRRLQPKYMKLLGGAVLAGAILLPWSVKIAGVPAYKEFFHHIGVHNNTPLTNHMGLKTVIATVPENRMKYSRDNRLLDPFERWKEGRRARYHSLRPVYYGVLALFIAGLSYASWRLKSIWVAMGLGLILIVSMVEATCYYYSVWIFAGILTKAKRSMEIAVIGLAAVGQLLSVQFYYIDDKFTALSALYIAFTIAMVGAFIRKPESILGAEAIPVPASPPLARSTQA